MALLYVYVEAMFTINISSLKNQLSAVLKKVRGGEEVLVMDRTEPVARISAVGRSSVTEDAGLLFHDLEKRGIIARATGPLPSRRRLESRLVRLKTKGVSAVRVLLREREESLF